MRRLALPALVVIALAACAGGPGAATAPVGAAATLPGSTLQASGFLGDYSSLSKVPGSLDTWQWGRPGTDWKSYTRIMVMPIEVWINPQAAYPGIQPDVYKQMTDSFRAVLTDSFRMGGYQIVDQPGPGVLRLHIALTGVTPERPGLTPLDILPIKIAFNVARTATGTDKTVIAVSGEVEALDGVTGQRVFAQVTTRKDAHLFVGQNLTCDDVREGEAEWASQARTRLEAVRVGTPR
jgi:hypothetical protein